MRWLARFAAATLSVAHTVSRATAGVFVPMLVTAVCVAIATAPAATASTAPPTTPAPSAAHPTGTVRLSLSTDGMHFSGNPGSLFAHPRLVPGRPVTADLWIRNASPDPTDLTIRLAAPGLVGSGALTLTVGAGKTASSPTTGAILLPTTRLAPRATVRIPVTVEIPARATERTGAFAFALAVTLGQAMTTIPAGPNGPAPTQPSSDDPLPNTGFAAADHLLIAAILLIMGVALARSVRHRLPIERTDRP